MSPGRRWVRQSSWRTASWTSSLSSTLALRLKLPAVANVEVLPSNPGAAADVGELGDVVMVEEDATVLGGFQIGRAHV